MAIAIRNIVGVASYGDNPIDVTRNYLSEILSWRLVILSYNTDTLQDIKSLQKLVDKFNYALMTP